MFEELAKTYSEGSDELYNCLLELWKNGFENTYISFTK